MPLTLVTPPSVEPLAVADARDRLKISVTSLSDTALNALIKAARQKIEKQYGLALINQGWSLVIDRFPGEIINPIETGFYPPEYWDSRWRPNYGTRISRSEIKIDLAPLKAGAVQSVNYTDTDGNPQVLDPATYNLIIGDLTSSIVLANETIWPATAYVSGAVQVSFNAGFGADGTSVPETIKSAMSLHISHLRSLMAQNLFLSLNNIPGVLEQRFIVGTGSADVIDAAVSSLMQDYVRPSL